jgi:hypothetical protein
MEGATSLRQKSTATGAVLAGLTAAIVAMPVSSADAHHSSVKRCKPQTVYKEKGFRYRATHIKRSARIGCRKTHHLLQAAYGQGPLKPTRVTYPHHDSSGRPYGRPIVWLRGGWRCTNGAGGALCWNAHRKRFNAIHLSGVKRRFSVTADVGYVAG